MRKSNWIVAAIAAVACGVLLCGPGSRWASTTWTTRWRTWSWPPWWAASCGPRASAAEKMRLAFIGEGVVYNPEAGLVMPDAGESELAALERTLSGMAFPDEVAALDERMSPAFRWVVRSRKFDRNGEVWEGEVVAAHDPDAEPRPFSSRENLAALLAAWGARPAGPSGPRHSQPRGGRRSDERRPPPSYGKVPNMLIDAICDNWMQGKRSKLDSMQAGKDERQGQSEKARLVSFLIVEAPPSVECR